MKYYVDKWVLGKWHEYAGPFDTPGEAEAARTNAALGNPGDRFRVARRMPGTSP